MPRKKDKPITVKPSLTNKLMPQKVEKPRRVFVNPEHNEMFLLQKEISDGVWEDQFEADYKPDLRVFGKKSKYRIVKIHKEKLNGR